MAWKFNPLTGKLDYYEPTAGPSEMWVGSTKAGLFDENGNLKIKGVIITEDDLSSPAGTDTKIIMSGTTWEFWVNNVKVGILDADGNLKIKGTIKTEDSTV